MAEKQRDSGDFSLEPDGKGNLRAKAKIKWIVSGLLSLLCLLGGWGINGCIQTLNRIQASEDRTTRVESRQTVVEGQIKSIGNELTYSREDLRQLMLEWRVTPHTPAPSPALTQPSATNP